MKRALIASLLLLSTACELPWSSARLKMSSERWTDYIHVDVDVKNISGTLFGCNTHAGCVQNIRDSIAVPTGPVAQTERVLIGAEIVEGGGEKVEVSLTERGDEVDLHVSFSAPSASSIFQGAWLPSVDTGSVPTMSTSTWQIEEPLDLPSSGGIEDGVLVTYIDLSKAPKNIVLRSDGNPDALPLYLSLPGLKPVLQTTGLIGL